MSYQPIRAPSNSRVFRQEAIQLALSHAPSIFPCAHCQHPVAEGYGCNTCGSDSPCQPDGAEFVWNGH